jgi:hypothetical protein
MSTTPTPIPDAAITITAPELQPVPEKSLCVIVPGDLLELFPRNEILDHAAKLFERLRIVGRMERTPQWND